MQISFKFQFLNHLFMSIPKVGINGFGRIGRLVLRALLEMDQKVDIVLINDIADNKQLAHLFEFDSIHGKFDGSVEVNEKELIFNGDPFIVTSEKDPSKIPWKDWDTDFVVESTGIFRTRTDLNKHLEAGAKQVILSAPSKNDTDVDVTLVRGINTEIYDSEKHKLISNASCTTNCLAPTISVLDKNWGVDQGHFSTVHAYTNDQRLLDSLHKDYRRMRSAGLNIFPTSTGASKAIGIILPQLAGKIDGIAIRVPTPNVSLVDLAARLKEDLTIDDLKEAYKRAENGELSGILQFEERQLVSTDFNHNSHSAIIDGPTLGIVNGNMLKVLAWYDNEWGYANRTAELIHEIYSKNNKS